MGRPASSFDPLRTGATPPVAEAARRAEALGLRALVPMPPLYVGGRGEPAPRRAARSADHWMPMWLTADELGRRAERLAALGAGHGRPAPGLALLIDVRVDPDEAAARAQAAAHLKGQYGLPPSAVERWTPLGSIERVRDQLREYEEIGVREFVLMPLGADPLGQYERLAEVIAPLRGSQP